MPLRVKCRCGQELVLRFNEWVYALFGLLVLSLLVNGTALVLLVLKLSAPPRPEGSPEIGREAGSPVLPPRWSAAELLSQAEPPSQTEPLEAAPEPPIHAAEPDLAPPGPKARDESPPPAGEHPPDSRAARALVVKPERLPRLLLPESRLPLERVLVVGRAEEPRLLLAFLYDDDPVVRRSALRKLLRAPPPADRDSLRDQLSIALPAASLFFGDGGPELFQRLSGRDQGADLRAWQEWAQKSLGIDPERKPAAEVLSPLQVRAQALLVSSPGAQALWKLVPGSTGETDLLLALDITESMEEPLQALARSEWLPHAITWSIPHLRAGLLFYRDEVVGAVGLGAEPTALLRALAGLKAEGGGDVPEGVHEALKAALQLGRFDWRPNAVKHIIFVGDAPPPRAEVPSLLSLARECHTEGGYRIHAISVNPTEGRTATLNFPELASAGGGRAVTAATDRMAEEVFLILFPPEIREELIHLLPLIVPSVSP